MSSGKGRGFGAVTSGVIVLVSIGSALAFAPTGRPRTANMDKRAPASSGAQLTADRQQAVTQLQSRLPSARIDYDKVTGAPSWVSSTIGFLSGPPDLEIQRAGGLGLATNDPHRAIKAFLVENSSLFGHGIDVLTNATIAQDYVTAHNGMRTVVWQQELDGIPVFEGLLIGHISKRGELVNISSHFLPDIVGSSGLDSTSRSTLENAPPISPQQAVANALTNIAETITVDGVTPTRAASNGPEKKQSFTAAPVIGDAHARLVWLPMNRSSIRLCWSVQLAGRSTLENFRIVVDASSGDVLVRLNLTCNFTDATYRVFTRDSPTPFSPGHQAPSSVQPGFPCTPPDANPPNYCRVLVTLPALSETASPLGWINDVNNTTVGNNVSATTNPGLAPQPPPQGNNRVFDFPIDFTLPPGNSQAATTVNLFYWCNWMHDRLYELGFTEAAGNFQEDNFGRGGLGGDSITAYAQYGTLIDDPLLRNGAQYWHRADGDDFAHPEIWMFIFDGPSPDRDSAFDAEVILHEYTHGLSNRCVGGGNQGSGITELQPFGLSEGWSDFYALSLLSEESDDVHAKYPMGGYPTYQLEGTGFTENYYYGIRRYPYTTDMGEIDPQSSHSVSGI